MTAQVHSINRSPGGVPKTLVASAWIDVLGVEGDRQTDTKHHGGPDRAVCIYSLEVIEALAAEGHRIGVGTTGENLTVRGVDWAAIQPGLRLRVGGAALEVTSFTSPCKTIRHSFTDERYKRISQKLHPGWSRVCARFLQTGIVTVGDAVVIEGSASLPYANAPS